MAAGFPIALIQEKIHDKNISAILSQMPATAKLGLTGSATKAKWSLNGDFINDLVVAAGKQQLGKLLGDKSGNKDENSATDTRDGKSGKKSDAEKINDILGGLIGGGTGDATKADGTTPTAANPTDPNAANTSSTKTPPADQPSDDGKRTQAQKRRDEAAAAEKARQDAADKAAADKAKQDAANQDPSRGTDTPAKKKKKDN